MSFVQIQFKALRPDQTLRRILAHLEATKTHAELARHIRNWMECSEFCTPPGAMERLVSVFAEEMRRDFEKNGHHKEESPSHLIHIESGCLDMWFRLRQEDRWIESLLLTESQLAHNLAWAIRCAISLWMNENIRENGVTPNDSYPTANVVSFPRNPPTSPEGGAA